MSSIFQIYKHKILKEMEEEIYSDNFPDSKEFSPLAYEIIFDEPNISEIRKQCLDVIKKVLNNY